MFGGKIAFSYKCWGFAEARIKYWPQLQPVGRTIFFNMSNTSTRFYVNVSWTHTVFRSCYYLTVKPNHVTVTFPSKFPETSHVFLLNTFLSYLPFAYLSLIPPSASYILFLLSKHFSCSLVPAFPVLSLKTALIFSEPISFIIIAIISNSSDDYLLHH